MTRNNAAGVGDTVVTVMETRPLSKLKRWRLLEISGKGQVVTACYRIQTIRDRKLGYST